MSFDCFLLINISIWKRIYDKKIIIVIIEIFSLSSSFSFCEVSFVEIKFIFFSWKFFIFVFVFVFVSVSLIFGFSNFQIVMNQRWRYSCRRRRCCEIFFVNYFSCWIFFSQFDHNFRCFYNIVLIELQYCDRCFEKLFQMIVFNMLLLLFFSSFWKTFIYWIESKTINNSSSLSLYNNWKANEIIIEKIEMIVKLLKLLCKSTFRSKKNIKKINVS